MKRNENEVGAPVRGRQAMHDQSPARAAGRRLLRRVGWSGLWIVASIVPALVFLGCGSHDDGTVAVKTQSSGTEATAPASYTAPVAVQEAAAPSRPAPVAADSLPPEVSAWAAYPTVLPGGVLEITAEASPDVAGIVLDDGFGRRQSFTYDAVAKLWRTFYRAPMRAADRLGLSVTATNGVQRWRRVWVFVSVQPDTEEEIPDTTSER